MEVVTDNINDIPYALIIWKITYCSRHPFSIHCIHVCILLAMSAYLKYIISCGLIDDVERVDGDYRYLPIWINIGLC